MLHVDLVGPTEPSIKNEVHALMIRDEATDFPMACGLTDKACDTVTDAF